MSRPDAPPWRIALDVGPVHSRPAGVGVYAQSLARGLAELMGGALALIGVRSGARALEVLDGVERYSFRSPNYHSWMQLLAEGQARRSRAQLAHYTNAAAPLAARLPYVVTLHDLSLMRLPGTHPVVRLATAPVMLWSLVGARAVIVPSSWTQSELARLRIARRRVTVIHHAATSVFEPQAEEDADHLAALGLEAGSFILAVGTLEPRKNLTRLITAFEQLARDRSDLRLVLAGAPGWHYEPILERAHDSLFAERIVFPGYLAPAALAALTRASAAVAYVSVYEGFGMPILDAMGHGAAVVASDRTAMPEAAGGAAVLVDPYDTADIARGLAHAIAERGSLIEAGRARAARRSWNDVAAEHIEVYRWALARD